MATVDAFDRVAEFLDELEDMPLEILDVRLKDIEKDIFSLFKRVERLHSLSTDFQRVDLSEDIYALLRMLKNRKKVVKSFPLLSRAAGLL